MSVIEGSAGSSLTCDRTSLYDLCSQWFQAKCIRILDWSTLLLLLENYFSCGLLSLNFGAAELILRTLIIEYAGGCLGGAWRLALIQNPCKLLIQVLSCLFLINHERLGARWLVIARSLGLTLILALLCTRCTRGSHLFNARRLSEQILSMLAPLLVRLLMLDLSWGCCCAICLYLSLDFL